MRVSSLAVLLVSCGSFLTSYALPISGGDDASIEARYELPSVVDARDMFSEELVTRGPTTPKPKPQAQAPVKANAKGAPAPAAKTSTNSKQCEMKKTVKRELGLFRRGSSSAEYWKAVGDLGQACDTLGISYILLGGTACAALGNPRVTEDIDIVAHSASAPGTEVQALVKQLKGRLDVKVDAYGCPTIHMDGIEVDIFDPTLWPDRNYMELLRSPYTVSAPKTSQKVKTPQPAALLKDKTAAAADRANHKKGLNDKADVEFLKGYIARMK